MNGYRAAQYAYDRRMPSDEPEYFGTVTVTLDVNVPEDELVDATFDFDFDLGMVIRVHEPHLYTARDLEYLNAYDSDKLRELAEETFVELHEDCW